MDKLTFDGIKKTFVNQFQHFHFFIIWLCILMQMLTWGHAYRVLAYINMVIVMLYVLNVIRKKITVNLDNAIYFLVIIPFLLITLHFLAVGNLIIIKEIRHILLALFLALGVWLLAKENPMFIKKNIFFFAIVLIVIYSLIQVIAIVLLNQQYGTTKNPHYLALYSAAGLIVSVYCYFRAGYKIKIVISASALLLGFIILNTSSRPTWIGLICAGILALFFLNPYSRRFFSILITLFLIGLTLTNLGNFAGRFESLLLNLSTEERVAIWHDTWKMQNNSSGREWVIGHGLDSFEEDFKPFSSYHLLNIDLNSPHNFVLELLYVSGVIGLFICILTLCFAYQHILLGVHKQNQYKNIYLLLFVLITSNLILVSITLPFFSSYNLNIIAIVVGCSLYLSEIQKRAQM